MQGMGKSADFSKLEKGVRDRYLNKAQNLCLQINSASEDSFSSGQGGHNKLNESNLNLLNLQTPSDIGFKKRVEKMSQRDTSSYHSDNSFYSRYSTHKKKLKEQM
jgi:hypothetical protein